jgi:sulfur relay (sulfurtransferase) DsrF/TusC family protein
MTDEERLREAVKEALLLDGFLECLTPEKAEAMVEKDYQETAKILDEFKILGRSTERISLSRESSKKSNSDRALD